jgi:hypothetical protein
MYIYIHSKHGEIPQLQEAPFIINPFLEALLVCTTHYIDMIHIPGWNSKNDLPHG